jgi:dihydroorotase
MSEAMLIRGARVIDPAHGTDQTADVLLRDGLIVSIGPSLTADGVRVVEATGLVLAPGFIDLHTHLREPGFEHKETIASGVAAAARGGFTTICCMPNTNPAIDNASVVRFVLDEAKAAGPVRVLPIGAVTRGRAGQELADMEELARAGVVAFSDDGNPVATAHLMQMALTYASELGLPVIDHCEDRDLTHGVGVNEGWVSSRLGLPGYPSAAEESMVARDIALAELTGGHFHAAHISTAGGVDLIRRAKERGLRVSAEVTPHHLTMSEEWVLGVHDVAHPQGPLTTRAYDTRAKVSPPLRTPTDAAALATALREGIIDAVATDHAPHAFADKAVPFEEAAVGISVLETALGLLLRLVDAGALDLPTLLHRLTMGPAGVLGKSYADLASLKPGSPADLVLFDPAERWTVETSAFASKGANTPLDGEPLQGKVKLTVAGGEVAYDGLTVESMKPKGGRAS